MKDGEHVSGVVPRIRDITGIRIHQLTLPESLALASKLRTDDQDEEDEEDVQTPLAGPSSPHLHRVISHGSQFSRRERRISTSTLPGATRPMRERSASSSIIPSSPVTRGPRRARAPTLAGEAMSQGLDRSTIEKVEVEETKEYKLARCFIVLKLPRKQPKKKDSAPNGSKHSPTKALRIRTTSMDHQRSPKDIPLVRTSSDKARQRLSHRPSLSKRTSSNSTLQSPLPSPLEEPPQGSIIPFYISPIHRRSVYPRFSSLSSDDFAPWMTVEEAAGTEVELEVWYEDSEWKLLDGVPTTFSFEKLKRLSKREKVDQNTVLFSFRSDPNGLYYLTTEEAVEKGRGVDGVVERSIRETKMKRGTGIGGLHQLVNMQSVLSDTKRGVEEIQRNIDRMLLEDIDHRAIRRDLRERGERCKWIQEKIDEVHKTTREVSAHVTLQEQALEHRRSQSNEGHERLNLLHAQATDLTEEIYRVDSERMELLNAINHYRTHHAQTLDSLFPISPLHPPSLLYSILDVPLPIPSGPKDPAPPISVPSSSLPEGIAKIDERTTAAALGYVALVVQILGNLGGAVGGIPYPVTCAGSRSLVKDVVSVMQGPRNFPLYIKGVERYRYEYAVFLLNKNIETESNIRLLDLRHTLPNLKVLLLTLSSPVPPSSSTSYPTLSRSSTFVDSRTSSRVTSAAFPKPYASSQSHGSADVSPHKVTGDMNGSNLASPTKATSRLRRSLLIRTDQDDDEKSVESEDAATVSELQVGE